MPAIHPLPILRHWAYTHPRAAQWLIAAILVLAGVVAFGYGLLVAGTGWYAAGWPLGASLAALAVLVALRVAWRDKAPGTGAWIGFHIAAILVFMSLWGYVGSRFPVKYGHTWADPALTQVQAAHAALAQRTPAMLRGPLARVQHAARQMPVAVKILLTLLVIVGAIALGYVVAGLACALACSEMGLLAAIVAIAGLVGILAGGFLLIRRIWRGKRQREALPE
ncbi:MAG: hypothetical protein OHK0039_33250 [Bacteroidia bacterium]